MVDSKLYNINFVSNISSSIKGLAGTGFFLFAFFLPLHTGASNLFLIISLAILIVGIFKEQKKDKRFVNRKNWKFLFFTPFSFFLLHLVGLIYSDSPVLGLSYIERSLSFLLVPVILLFTAQSKVLYFKKPLLSGLIVGSLASVIILIAVNLYHYFSAQNLFHIGTDLFDYYHTYLKFTEPLNQHPTYLGVYYLIAIIFVDEITQRKYLRYFIIAMFCLGFLFLNSRIIFAMLLLVVFYYLGKTVKNMVIEKRYLRLIRLSAMFLIGLMIAIQVISKSYIGSRIKNIYDFELSSDTKVKFNSHSSSNPRMARYISAIKLIRKKPLFGHGTTGEKIKLKQQFLEDGLGVAAEQNYNSHNQYIGFTVRYGVVGLVCLIFFFCSNFYLAWSKKDRHYLFLVTLVASVCLVENYFDRNFGITFSAVFFTIFSYQVLEEEEV